MAQLSQAIAAAVREHLRRRDIRQIDLVPVLGLSQPALSSRLTGRTPFTLENLERLADHLGIPVTELLEPPAPLVDHARAVAS
jgi:antitoxin component HigA of HigAB toxin-antitoxin module